MTNDNIILITDSACDVPAKLRHELNIDVYKIPVFLNDETYDYNCEIDDGFMDFYSRLKKGALVKTAAISPFGYREIFEPFLKAGKDVLYVAYSGKISSALDYFWKTAQELMEEYPGRKIVLVDTLNLSFGGGIMVVTAAKMLKEGKSLEEIKAFLDEEKMKIGLFFTPETLTYLKRGGRLSGAKAVIGNMLNLKPILYVGDKGVLERALQVSGRKKSFQTIIDLAKKNAENLSSQEIYVLHSFCEEDAKEFAKMAKEQLMPAAISISSIGPVIGAHCGPGTIGLCFKASKREFN